MGTLCLNGVAKMELVYLKTTLCVHVCKVCMCTHGGRGQPELLLPLQCPSWGFGDVFSLAWSSPNRLSWLASESQDLPGSTSHRWGCMYALACPPSFLRQSGGSDLDPRTARASPFLTQSSPSPETKSYGIWPWHSELSINDML